MELQAIWYFISAHNPSKNAHTVIRTLLRTHIWYTEWPKSQLLGIDAKGMKIFPFFSFGASKQIKVIIYEKGNKSEKFIKEQ